MKQLSAYLLLVCTVMLGLIGCDSSAPIGQLGTKVNRAATDQKRQTDPTKEQSRVLVAKIERFCADCHKMPDPTTFPKSRWPEEVIQGFNFYVDSQRTDMEEPDRLETIKYFQAGAPDHVDVPRADQMEQPPSPLRFVLDERYQAKVESPSTAQVQWDSATQSIFFSNMRDGELRQWSFAPEQKTSEASPGSKLIATGSHTCRATKCDWNQDGFDDFLIGEMGSFPVGDHEKGRISLVLGTAEGYQPPKILQDKLSRVVEAKPFDYDEDGRMDILAADFGWRKTGALRLLKNIGGSAESPQMESIILDPRHGPVGVDIGDLDGDGKQDFLVGYGQEFETLELHYGQGKGKFQREIVASLADPSYNLSAFQIIDLDQDGKLDIVYTCGDTMDALLAKPYHGVGWVRNLGERKWEHRWLGLLVGALASSTADLDGDGDLDVVAVGMFPKAKDEPEGTFDSICWWEQTPDLNFVRHSVERDRCTYASCTTADVNGDGRQDLIVGEWLIPNVSAFRVYLNQPVTESTR